MVLCQATCSIIVAQERRGGRRGEAKAGEEFTKEGKFVGGIMESNIFCIAGRVRDDSLFLRHPRYRA
jgi:hypothetical protein